MSNINTTASMNQTMKTYYDRKMLDTIKPQLVHAKYGQKRPIPKHSGKTIEFRKWNLFGPLTSPLKEGIVPAGQLLSQTSVEATVDSYGGYTTLTDMVQLTGFDPVINDTVEMMADQGARTLDTIARDTLCAGTNVLFAGGKLSRGALTASDKLTALELRRAVRLLKKAYARPIVTRGGKGYYVAICGPDVVYDLQGDPTWTAVATYQNSEEIYSGEVGRLFGCIIVETPEAKVFPATGKIGSSGVTSLTAAAGAPFDARTRVLKVTEAITTDNAALMAGAPVSISGINAVVLSAQAGAAGAATLTLSDDPGAAATSAWGGKTVAAANGSVDINCTLVLGQNAYGTIDIEDSSAVTSIIKPLGSGGTADPLNQVSTVGWKVPAFAVKVLQPLWMVRIESAQQA